MKYKGYEIKVNPSHHEGFTGSYRVDSWFFKTPWNCNRATVNHNTVKEAFDATMEFLDTHEDEYLEYPKDV